jgi:UDP-N-acetyl-D-mannosaminuronic acid transferase (WecB/TagA/CpsF family)
MLDTVEDLQKQLKTTEMAVEDVAKTWKDSQFIKFKDGFEQDKEQINPLCKKIEEFEGDVLQPLENILREYLDL